MRGGAKGVSVWVGVIAVGAAVLSAVGAEAAKLYCMHAAHYASSFALARFQGAGNMGLHLGLVLYMLASK
jgi:hypothetical protein